MIVVFDTETSGLPKSYGAPASEIDNWPRMVQLSWQVYSDDRRMIAEHNYIIKPDGFDISPESSLIHGISTERAMREGVGLNFALVNFMSSILTEGTIFVAHNISFDEKIVGAELIRSKFQKAHDALFMRERICTMLSTTEFCGLPGKYGNKWPKLQELHVKLFGEEFQGAHDAIIDVRALSRCYFELIDRGIILDRSVKGV